MINKNFGSAEVLLRFFARVQSVHFSTKISGNRLSLEDVEERILASMFEDMRQRRVMFLFMDQDTITSKDIEKLLRLKPRTARALCKKWVDIGFLGIAQEAKKNRRYFLK